MENKNIFTIQFERELLDREIEANDGEVNEAQIEQIEINREELDSKVEKYLYSIKEKERRVSIIQGEQEYHKAELKRLDALKKPLETRISNMTKTIDGALRFFGIDKIDFDIFKVSFRKSKQTIITDESLLPKCCFAPKVISKSEIKKLIETGKVKKGAEIIENTTLQIK